MTTSKSNPEIALAHLEGPVGDPITEKVTDGDEALKILHNHFEPYTAEEELIVKRKIDRRMLPVMLVVNGLQFVDKMTISLAATYGIIEETHLVGQQFSLLISIFYFAYLAAQYPVNVLMQKFPTGKVITISFFLWGATLAVSGAATTFPGLAAGRFFLGVFESCVNPGFILLSSAWWKREEQASRIGLWYCANGLLQAAVGPIFYAIGHVQDRHLFPYQLMFIIFGALTALVGVVLYFFLPDSPITANFLTERERVIAVERLRSNRTGIKNEHHKPAHVKEVLTDVKVWLLVLATFLHNMTNSLQTSFQGIVIEGFGFSSHIAVLMYIPGGIIMAVSTVSAAWFLSTRRGEDKRILVIILCYIPGIVAAAMLRWIPQGDSTKGVRLFAILLVPIVPAAAAVMYSLLSSNIAGYTKKSVSGVVFFVANSVANIVSPLTFLSRQAPKYDTGIAVSLTCFAALIVLFAVLYVLYKLENKRRDNDPDGVADIDDNEDLIESFSDLTDKENMKFRYKT